MCCICWGNRAKGCCNCRGCGCRRHRDPIYSERWVVLYAPGSHVTRGLSVRETPHSVDYWRRRACMHFPAALSLWIEPDWDALGLWEISYVHLWVSFTCMILNLPQLSGYCNQSDGWFVTAKALIPQCLDACRLIMIRKFFQKTWRYIDAYKKGLDACQAAVAAKKYKSHRKVALLSDIISSMTTNVV